MLTSWWPGSGGAGKEPERKCLGPTQSLHGSDTMISCLHPDPVSQSLLLPSKSTNLWVPECINLMVKSEPSWPPSKTPTSEQVGLSGDVLVWNHNDHEDQGRKCSDWRRRANCNSVPCQRTVLLWRSYRDNCKTLKEFIFRDYLNCVWWWGSRSSLYHSCNFSVS